VRRPLSLIFPHRTRSATLVYISTLTTHHRRTCTEHDVIYQRQIPDRSTGQEVEPVQGLRKRLLFTNPAQSRADHIPQIERFRRTLWQHADESAVCRNGFESYAVQDVCRLLQTVFRACAEDNPIDEIVRRYPLANTAINLIEEGASAPRKLGLVLLWVLVLNRNPSYNPHQAGFA
jgi:hypothetical protein